MTDETRLLPSDETALRPNDKTALRPATAEEIAESIAFGLRYDGRKRVHHADEMMARVTAERLVRHLERSGYVVMRRPVGAGAAVRLGAK